MMLAQWRIKGYMTYRDVVVSDLRFENEATMIRGMGGTIIHLARPDAATVEHHVSEAGVEFLANGDLQLINNGTIEDLLFATEAVL